MLTIDDIEMVMRRELSKIVREMKVENTKQVLKQVSTIEETAEILSVSKTTVYVLIEKGLLETVKLGEKCSRVTNKSILEIQKAK